MASRSTTQTAQPAKSSPFLRQREALVGEIAIVRFPHTPLRCDYKIPCTDWAYSIMQSLENVLQSMNKLNRSLEGVIAVGNEFGAVEALWSQFEGVMAQEPGEEGKEGESEGSVEEEGKSESAGEAEKVDGKGRG